MQLNERRIEFNDLENQIDCTQRAIAHEIQRISLRCQAEFRTLSDKLDKILVKLDRRID